MEAYPGSRDIVQRGIVSLMWAVYWKRFIPIQCLILLISAVLRFYFGTRWAEVGIFFGTMQIAGIVGAWSSARILRRMEQDERNVR